jgi:uncharacterized protein YabN with tetrapyrrole methylase and pyrophosphatase domain
MNSMKVSKKPKEMKERPTSTVEIDKELLFSLKEFALNNRIKVRDALNMIINDYFKNFEYINEINKKNISETP